MKKLTLILVFCATQAVAEDFLLVGGFEDSGLTDRLVRLAIDTGSQVDIAPPSNVVNSDMKTFAVHQHNRHVYFFGRDPSSIPMTWRMSLEDGRVTSMGDDLNQYGDNFKRIDPDLNVFYEIVGDTLEAFDLNGNFNHRIPFFDFGGNPGPRYDYSVDNNYVVNTSRFTIYGGAIGDPTQLLIRTARESPHAFNTVAIDETNGLIYAATATSDIYTVAMDGSNVEYLGNAGVLSQTAFGPEAMEVHDGILYLANRDDVYRIPRHSIGQSIEPFLFCDNCAGRIQRMEFVHNDFAQAGDTDVDGDVDITDFNALAGNFDPAGFLDKVWANGDFGGDHVVDITDFNELASNFSPNGYDRRLDIQTSTTSPVPEPQTLLLLVAGLVAPQFASIYRRKPTRND